MRNQSRIGEALMLASGIGVAAAGASLGLMPLLYEAWLLRDWRYLLFSCTDCIANLL